MNLLKTLESDHRELKRLAGRLEMTTERGVKVREKLFTEFKILLDSHSKAEEFVLYDRLVEVDAKSRERAFEGYEEHHVADILLRELTSLPKDNERWGAKFGVLKELLEHHIEEEQREIFQQARKAFKAPELERMEEQFLSMKHVQKAGIGAPVRSVARVVRRMAG